MTVVDGRARRRERNRDAVVDALLELIRTTERVPGVTEIAAAAGVSARTVFRLFDDVDGLLRVAVEHQLAQLSPWLDAAAPDGDLPARIAAVVAHRSELFEHITPVRRLVLRNAAARPALLEGPREVDERLRRHARRAFVAELEALPRRSRALAARSIEAVTAWSTWNALRSDQGLDVDDAAEVLAHLVRSVVTAR